MHSTLHCSASFCVSCGLLFTCLHFCLRWAWPFRSVSLCQVGLRLGACRECIPLTSRCLCPSSRCAHAGAFAPVISSQHTPAGHFCVPTASVFSTSVHAFERCATPPPREVVMRLWSVRDGFRSPLEVWPGQEVF